MSQKNKKTFKTLFWKVPRDKMLVSLQQIQPHYNGCRWIKNSTQMRNGDLIRLGPHLIHSSTGLPENRKVWLYCMTKNRYTCSADCDLCEAAAAKLQHFPVGFFKAICLTVAAGGNELLYWKLVSKTTCSNWGSVTAKKLCLTVTYSTETHTHCTVWVKHCWGVFIVVRGGLVASRTLNLTNTLTTCH